MPVREQGLIVLNLPPSDVPLSVILQLSKEFVDEDDKKHGLAIIFDVT